MRLPLSESSHRYSISPKAPSATEVSAALSSILRFCMFGSNPKVPLAIRSSPGQSLIQTFCRLLSEAKAPGCISNGVAGFAQM